jgi:NADH-quinone oxidoreductase subunit A
MLADALWPLFLYGAAVLFIVLAMLGLSYLAGEKHRAHGEPFESGIYTVGEGRFRLSAQFYLVAMFFVIFDLEAVFIFAWALTVRETGWPGYIEMLVFVGILLAGLVYLWRLGALDWGPHRTRHYSSPQREGRQA